MFDLGRQMIRISVFIMASVFFISTFVHASEMDNRIESSAQDSYVFRTYLKDDAVAIHSKDGAVTLTGTVSETGHKSLAQETVQNLPGVKSVDNQLTLKGEEPAENSDAWLSMKVKASLLFHRNVNAIHTKVYVKEGTVTLQGDADSQAQKELTEEYVRGIEGVKDVKNEMTVVIKPEDKVAESTWKEKIDDASITAQVKLALMSHSSTSAFRTKVETTNGIVTVSGNAKSEAEKDLVTKLIMDINGVAGVHNDMIIQ